ncbi:MAG: cadherin-like beta sandwich domain-containing protein, partial [Clostridia bacterium]|nr:cadherin-like beta sandwich domain-containing protein [Clostridia bacterium]
MIDGEGYEWTDSRQGYVGMENPQGNFVKGNSENGYARITLLEDPSQNNLLKEIQINKGVLEPEVDYETFEYKVKLDPEDTDLTIYGVVDDIKATVEGNGTYDIPAGDTEIILKVTAESGDEREYKITVSREASDNSKPLNITIDGLIEDIINVNPELYGKLDPEEFNPEVHEYSMIVPSRIKKLIFDVEKGHKYQTVEGDGTVQLEPGENEIVITVTAEDGVTQDIYTYHITRDMSGNCLLESLTIDNVETDLEFDQEILEYFVIVENEVTHLDITAIPEMKEITPIIEGNTDLKVGLNDIYIIVTAPNGEQAVYIIHAYRKQSGNVFLSSLSVKNGETVYDMDPIYNKLLDTYTVTVPNDVEKVTIEAIPEAMTSKVKGDGEKTLRTGTNTFKLEVTAEERLKSILY